MPRTASNHTVQLIVVVLSFLFFSACGPVAVPNLFVTVEGELLPVLSRKVDNPTDLRSSDLRGLRYFFPKTLYIPAPTDLALILVVDGSVSVALYADEKDETPFMQASFEGLGEPLLEFRLPLSAGSSLASIEIQLEDAQTATVKGFAL